jgi:hypothetical protein
MPSTFTWLDSSEKQRRKMKDVLDLFREQGTRDELGISTIRDAFADALFPGTGALQTRARYFFFIPWMYQALEDRKVPSANIERRARRFEVDLIDVLADSDDPDGAIGRQSRAALQRLPSNIYWSGLGLLGIRKFQGSQDQYHRSLDRYYGARRGNKNDDGERIDEISANWVNLPSSPPDFPASAIFSLAAEEADYLSERIIAAAPASFLAFLMRQTEDRADKSVPWDSEILDAVDASIRRQLEHGRNFSMVMHGAAVLYNLMLSEKVNNDEWVQKYRTAFAEWSSELLASRDALENRPLDDLWRCIEDCGAAIGRPTRQFVTRWVELVTAAPRPEAVADAPIARALVHQREVSLKQALARLDNPRARELWTGAAGLGRLTYRWYNARILCTDIFAARLE